MSGDAALLLVPRGARTLRVAVWGCSQTQNARIRDALSGRATITFANTERELIAQLDGLDLHCDAVILGLAGAGKTVAHLVREVLTRRSRAAVIVYCEPARDIPNIGSLAAAGVHQFLFWNVNDGAIGLRAIMDAARQQCAADGVMALLRPIVPPPLHPMIEAALARPGAVTDVRALANAVGVHRRTLFNRCERAAFLNPAELLGWTRLTLVAHLLETTGATVETISIELGYPSPTALRNTIKRYTRRRATEIRAAGGARLVVELLRERTRAPGAGTLHVV